MNNLSTAILSPDDSRTFFRLFIPLLSFTNQKYELYECFDEDICSEHADYECLKEVADALWENPETIDEYIKATIEQFGEIDHEDRRLLESWRHPISGRFILERHLANGSVFIDLKTGKVYLVKGLTETWRDMFANAPPPIALETTMIPFNDCIISDGLNSVLDVDFGTESLINCKVYYMKAKKNGKIISSL